MHVYYNALHTNSISLTGRVFVHCMLHILCWGQIIQTLKSWECKKLKGGRKGERENEIEVHKQKTHGGDRVEG